jgi:hypothetical protein
MPKGTQTQHDPSSDLGASLELPVTENQESPETPEKEKGKGKGKEGKGLEKKESKVHRFSQGKGFYTPKKTERTRPVLLTADQYLKKAGHDKGISGLVKSLYKTEILTFEAWDSKVKTLLKKRT